jgi:hypothetical protein
VTIRATLYAAIALTVLGPLVAQQGTFVRSSDAARRGDRLGLLEAAEEPPVGPEPPALVAR